MSAPRTLAPAALGGLLIALSLPPWPVSTGAWPLGLVGAAIVFAAVDGRRLRARIGGGMAAGLGLYLPGLWWMRDFSWPGFVVTVVLEAAILAGALALAPLGARARPGARIAAFPAALVLAEAVRGAWPFGGLPLAGIELGQVAGPLAPAARLGGRFLIVALVGLAGVAVASAVVAVGPEIPPGGGEAGGRRARARARAAGGSSPGVHRRGVVAGSRTGTDGRRGVRGLTSSLAATAVVVAVTVGGAAAPDGRPDGTLTVAAVQGGGLRGLRAVGRDPGPVFQAHLRAGASVGPGVDLVLWPEDVVDVAGPLAGSPEERSVAAQASDLGATVVVGVVEEVGDDRFRNAAVVFGPDGTVVDRYDKVHRVPFGEYIPARALFARLADVSAVPRDAIAGRGPGVIDTPRGRLGVLVSYEVFFQDRGRDAVRAGGRLLLVPTNASSFGDAQVPAHELAVARLRALETGRWVVQAAPTGYSAIVDHRGRVRSRSGLGEAAVLRHQVGLRAGRTLFVTLGPSPVLLLAVAILAVARIRRRKPERGNDRFADEVEGEADKEHKEEDPC